MTKKHWLYIALVITFIFTIAISLFQKAGTMPAVIVCGSMLGGAIGWFFTSLRYPTDPRKLLAVYLLTAAMLYFHIWEEYLFGFGPKIAALVGSNWTESEFLVQIVFILPTFWILGAIGIYYKNPLGNFIAWFVFFGMFLGEPTHLLVFPNLVEGRYAYFPGMWTALLPMVMGVWGLYIIIKDYRQQKANL